MSMLAKLSSYFFNSNATLIHVSETDSSANVEDLSITKTKGIWANHKRKIILGILALGLGYHFFVAPPCSPFRIMFEKIKVEQDFARSYSIISLSGREFSKKTECFFDPSKKTTTCTTETGSVVEGSFSLFGSSAKKVSILCNIFTEVFDRKGNFISQEQPQLTCRYDYDGSKWTKIL